jgi:hypothetical protein
MLLGAQRQYRQPGTKSGARANTRSALEIQAINPAAMPATGAEQPVPKITALRQPDELAASHGYRSFPPVAII